MNVLLVGCGRMGGAMARRWVDEHRVLVFDPAASVPAGAERVEALDSVDLPGDLVVVIAVKPQVFSDLGPTLVPLAARGCLFLSIMAGLRLASIGGVIGGSERIVRAMPNTPAAIGAGITALVKGGEVGDRDAESVEALLRPTGKLVWLGDEAELDLVTAVSGSGPAYFFRFTEALARAGTAAGLDAALAMELARETMIGAAALAGTEDDPLSELRRQVTSPGGTTAAGIAQMDDNAAIDRLVGRVVDAAAARSRTLAGG